MGCNRARGAEGISHDEVNFGSDIDRRHISKGLVLSTPLVQPWPRGPDTLSPSPIPRSGRTAGPSCPPIFKSPLPVPSIEKMPKSGRIAGATRCQVAHKSHDGSDRLPIETSATLSNEMGCVYAKTSARKSGKGGSERS